MRITNCFSLVLKDLSTFTVCTVKIACMASVYCLLCIWSAMYYSKSPIRNSLSKLWWFDTCKWINLPTSNQYFAMPTKMIRSRTFNYVINVFNQPNSQQMNDFWIIEACDAYSEVNQQNSREGAIYGFESLLIDWKAISESTMSTVKAIHPLRSNIT